MTQQEKKSLSRMALSYLDALWQTAMWLTSSSTEAERLVEDAYLEADRNWDDSATEANCRNWMFKNMVKVYSRRNKLDFLAHLSIQGDISYKPFSSAKIQHIHAVPRDIISAAINRLPVENRLAIVLSLFEKFTYPEIAEILGIERKTVCLKIYQGYMLIHNEVFQYVMTDDSVPSEVFVKSPRAVGKN